MGLGVSRTGPLPRSSETATAALPTTLCGSRDLAGNTAIRPCLHGTLGVMAAGHCKEGWTLGHRLTGVGGWVGRALWERVNRKLSLGGDSLEVRLVRERGKCKGFQAEATWSSLSVCPRTA